MPWEHDVISFSQQLLQVIVSITVRSGEKLLRLRGGLLRRWAEPPTPCLQGSVLPS